MGRTIESYRLALDRELQRWSGFARALRKDDRIVFDQLMDICKTYASAGSNSTRPVLFEPMVMSILLHQQKILNSLQKELSATRNKSNKS